MTKFLSFVFTVVFLFQVTEFSRAQSSEESSRSVNLVYKKMDSGVQTSMRGLSVVDNRTVWASGAAATILRSTDGGDSWQKLNFPGNQKVDFRDVHGFDKDNAVVMTAGQPAEFWRTEDGGKNWKMVFKDPRKASFYDSIVFFPDGKTGIGFSDPIDGHLQIVRTEDAGKTWSPIPKQEGTKVPEGTGGFAASGTCLCTFGKGNVAIALGGKIQEKNSQSQILISNDFGKTWTRSLCPISADKAAGIFSIASDPNGNLLVVGGDYLNWKKKDSIAAISTDKGKSWKVIAKGPGGFRSGVDAAATAGKTLWIAAGTSGFDYSLSPTNAWTKSKPENMHTIQFVPARKFQPADKKHLQTAFSTGPEGKIFRITILQNN